MIAETQSHIFRWPSRRRRRRVCFNSLLGSFTINDRNEGTATTTPQIKNLIGRASKNKRAARAVRTYEQIRANLCKTTTWNYLIYSFDDNLSRKPQISNSLYLI